MIYRLTQKGKDLKWSSWKRLGGCGLPLGGCLTQATIKSDFTLGQAAIENPYIGRVLARYAFNNLNKLNLSETDDAEITEDDS